MEALQRLAETSLVAAQTEAALREADLAAEHAASTAWSVVSDVRTVSGKCACGEEVKASVSGETVRWEERPLPALGQRVCETLAPWLTSIASLHRARFSLLDAARGAPDLPLELLLEPFFSSLKGALDATPPVPPPALLALQNSILLLCLRSTSRDPSVPPLLKRDVSVYMLDRLMAVRGLQWGRMLLQPPATSARTVLAFAARLFDEQSPAPSEAIALTALAQCQWHEAAKHAAGEEEACLASLSSLLARSLALNWHKVYAALAHFASMLAREPQFNSALPSLTALLCAEKRSRILASPLLPLLPFHVCKPTALVQCFARIYGLHLLAEEEIQTDENDPLELVRVLSAESDRSKAARSRIAEELCSSDTLMGLIYRAASPEAASLHQSALGANEPSLVRNHVPRLPLLHALYRIGRAAAQAAEKDAVSNPPGTVLGEAYGMITRMVASELAILSSLAIRPPERAALMQSEAGLYAEALCATSPQLAVSAVIGSLGRHLPELGTVRDSLFGPAALFGWTPDYPSLNWLAYFLTHRVLPQVDATADAPPPAVAEQLMYFFNCFLEWFPEIPRMLGATPAAALPPSLAPLAASLALKILCSGANWPLAPSALRCVALALIVTAPVARVSPNLLAEQLLCVGSGLNRLVTAPLPESFRTAFCRRSADLWANDLRFPEPPPYPDAPHPLRQGARDLYELCQMTISGSAMHAGPIARGPTIPRAPLVGYLLQRDALNSDVLAAIVAGVPQSVLISIFTSVYAILGVHPQLWSQLGSALRAREANESIRFLLSQFTLAVLVTNPSHFDALASGLRSDAAGLFKNFHVPDFASVALLAACGPQSLPALARAWLNLSKLFVQHNLLLSALVPLRFFFLLLWPDAQLRQTFQQEEHEFVSRIASVCAATSPELSHTYRALSLFAEPLCPGGGDLLRHAPLVHMLRASSMAFAPDQASPTSPNVPSTMLGQPRGMAPHPHVPVMQSGVLNAGALGAITPAPQPNGPGLGENFATLVLPPPLPPRSDDLVAEINRAATYEGHYSAALSHIEDPCIADQRSHAVLAVCRQTAAHLLAAQQQEEERASAVANLYALEETRVEQQARCPKGDCTGVRLLIPRLRPVQRPPSAHLLVAFRPARMRLLALCAAAAEGVAAALTLEENLVRTLAPSSRPVRVTALESAILRLIDMTLSLDADPFRSLISTIAVESASMPRLAASVSFHTALWSKLLNSHFSDARAVLLPLVQPSLFLQGAASLLLDFADSDTKSKRTDKYREAAEEAAKAPTLRPQERVLLLARFDWGAYLSAGGDPTALLGLYALMLADQSLAQQTLPALSLALFAASPLALRVELVRALLTSQAVVTGELHLASFLSDASQLGPEAAHAYYSVADSVDPLAAIRLAVALPHLPNPSLAAYLAPLMKRMPIGIRGRAAAEALGALLGRITVDEAMAALTNSVLPWLMRTDASLAPYLATPLRNLDWTGATFHLGSLSVFTSLLLSPLAQFALEVLAQLRWPRKWHPTNEPESYAVDLLYLCAERQVLDSAAKLPNVDERETLESQNEVAPLEVAAMRVVRWADDQQWRSDVAAARIAILAGGGVWRQVSAGRAIAMSVPSALHLLLHATPLLAPGRLSAYVSILRAAARVAYLGLVNPNEVTPSWRLNHVQQVELLSHMARLMQGLSARAAEQLDAMPLLALLWTELWDKGLDLVQAPEAVIRRAAEPADGTVPNEKIRALLSHMASTLPAPVLLAMMPHTARAPLWLEELVRDYFVWESEEPPRLATLIAALPARLSLPPLDQSHSYPLVLSALVRRAHNNFASASQLDEAWPLEAFSIATKCEPLGHYQLHMLPVWLAALHVYADQRTSVTSLPYLVKLLERHAPPKGSIFSRLTSEDTPQDLPLYLAARACLVYAARLTAQKKSRMPPQQAAALGPNEENALLEKLLATRSEYKAATAQRYQSFFNEAEAFLSPLCDLSTFAAALSNTLFPYAPYLLHASSGVTP